MSTILNTNGDNLTVPELHPSATGRFYIFTADWNKEVTYALRDGAVDVLKRAGIDASRIVSLPVAGTVELVNAAGKVLRMGREHNHSVEGVIVIGCVIRGDTPHFDYVCQIAAQGCAQLNALGEAPVIFGVLTVDDCQQAIDRAGGRLGNKGAEAAVAAIQMANLHARLNEQN